MAKLEEEQEMLVAQVAEGRKAGKALVRRWKGGGANRYVNVMDGWMDGWMDE